jgi:hypothetical protein
VEGIAVFIVYRKRNGSMIGILGRKSIYFQPGKLELTFSLTNPGSQA